MSPQEQQALSRLYGSAYRSIIVELDEGLIALFVPGQYRPAAIGTWEEIGEAFTSRVRPDYRPRPSASTQKSLTEDIAKALGL